MQAPNAQILPVSQSQVPLDLASLTREQKKIVAGICAGIPKSLTIAEVCDALRHIFQNTPEVQIIKYCEQGNHFLQFLKFIQNTDFQRCRYTITFLPFSEGVVGLAIDRNNKTITLVKYDLKKDKKIIYFDLHEGEATDTFRTDLWCPKTLKDLVEDFLPEFRLKTISLIKMSRSNPFVRLTIETIRQLPFKVNLSAKKINVQQAKPKSQDYDTLKTNALFYCASISYQKAHPNKTVGSLSARAKKVLAHAPKDCFSIPFLKDLHGKIKETWEEELSAKRLFEPTSIKRKLKAAISELINPSKKTLASPVRRIQLQLSVLACLGKHKEFTTYLTRLKAASIHQDVLLSGPPLHLDLVFCILFYFQRFKLLKEILPLYPRILLPNPIPKHDVLNVFKKTYIMHKIYLLAAAAEAGRNEVFYWVLDKLIWDGEDHPGYVDYDSKTWMTRALLPYNWRHMKIILDRKTLIDRFSRLPNRGYTEATTLYELMSCRPENPKVTQLLLIYGAGPNKPPHTIGAKKPKPTTILSEAIRNGRSMDIRLLLQYGADYQALLNNFDTYFPLKDESDPEIGRGLLTFLEYYLLVGSNDPVVAQRIIHVIDYHAPGMLDHFYRYCVSKELLSDTHKVADIYTFRKIPVEIPNKDNFDFDKVQLRFTITDINGEERELTPAKILGQRFNLYYTHYLLPKLTQSTYNQLSNNLAANPNPMPAPTPIRTSDFIFTGRRSAEETFDANSSSSQANPKRPKSEPY